MSWTINEQTFTTDQIPENALGFVYQITDTENGKKYIGKKKFFSNRTKAPLKGQKRKRKFKLESDWMTYFGSNDELKALAAEDPSRFKREIIRICYSLGELSYYEAKMQFDHDVLLKPDQYYNAFIGCKIHRNHVLCRAKRA